MMITKIIEPCYSIHEQGQDPLDGVLVLRLEPLTGWLCQRHRYYRDDNPDICSHIRQAKAMMEREARI